MRRLGAVHDTSNQVDQIPQNDESAGRGSGDYWGST
jgi:hypothetical protein